MGASRQTPLPPTANLTLDSPAQTPGTRSVDVPVFANDTQWDVITRGLPLLAAQAGLNAEGQKVFSEKWATRLEEAGQTHIYVNKTGQQVGTDGFRDGLDESQADLGTGSIGSYRLEFTQKHAEMLGDLKTLQQNQSLVAGIQSPELRREVLLGLNEMLVGGPTERLSAANGLINRAQPGMPEADTIQQSLMNLSERNDQLFNPVVQMAALRGEVNRETGKAGPYDPARLESLRVRTLGAVDNAGQVDSDPSLPSETRGDISREDAAWVNQQAARSLEQLGDKTGAKHREMIGRFYEVDPSERRKYESGMNVSIGRWKDTGEDMMRPTLKQEVDEREFKAANGQSETPWGKELGEDPQKREYKGPKRYVMNANGQLEKLPEQTFQQEGALRTEGVRKGARQSPVSPQREAPFESQNLNQRGSGRAMGVSGGVGLIEEANKWGTFLGDLVNNTTANRIAEGKRLKKAVDNVTTYPVPPPPERLPKLRMQMTAVYGPKNADVMMRRLEEMSHAFYGR